MARIPTAAVLSAVLTMFTAGAVAAAAAAKRKKAAAELPAGPPIAEKAPPAAVSKTMPAVLAEKVARAVITQDPEQLEAVAKECERAGYSAEAERLRVLAQELRARARGEPPPELTIPEVPVPGAKPGADAALALKVRQANALMDHLRSTRKYKEDRKKVTAFQALMDLKQDGLYGSTTALSSASLGVIPVKPFYWKKGTEKADKKAYRAEIMKLAQNDPARFDAWSEAAQV
jgi:hypothetical protein